MSAQPEPARKAGGSKDRILAVAVDEFAQKGFAAARIDEIARLAKANKQLIYYHFGTKAGLYEAVLGQLIETFDPIRSLNAESSVSVVELFNQNIRYIEHHDAARWQRLLAWEGVEYGGQAEKSIFLEAPRRAVYDAQTQVIARAKGRGEMPAAIDPEIISLLIFLATTGPEAFPQVTRLITGKDTDDPELRRALADTMRALLAAISTTDENDER